MKSELGRLFLFFLGSVVIFVTLFALFGPQGKKISLKEIEFNTTNSSELYFKNIRSYFYDKEEDPNARFILYKINNREKDSNKLKLQFLLVHNWLLNECYLIAEPYKTDFQIEWQYEDKLGSINLKGENNRAHFIFAAELFEQLDRKADMWILYNATKIPFSEEEKASLRTTLKDYFKLVGKVR
ncbi:MAG: hypothetical protein ACJASF_001451 [Vicingaceae bacterium]|jgi:hypothetical protein